MSAVFDEVYDDFVLAKTIWSAENRIALPFNSWENSDGRVSSETVPWENEPDLGDDATLCVGYDLDSSVRVAVSCGTWFPYLCAYVPTGSSVTVPIGWQDLSYDVGGRSAECFFLEDGIECPPKYSTCFGVSYLSKYNCSGRGSCVSFDQCECFEGRSGADCSCSGIVRDGYCWIYQSEVRTWFSAENSCRDQLRSLDRPCHLASVPGFFENGDLVNLIQEQEDPPLAIWIGLNDIGRSNHFSWSDGETSTYRRWMANEPSESDLENCVMFTGEEPTGLLSGFWSDFACIVPLPSVCMCPLCTPSRPCPIADDIWMNVEFGLTGAECDWEITSCPSIYEECNFIHYTDPLSCGTGECVAFDECQCPFDFGGEFCEIPACDGIVQTSPFVCSTHGECYADHTCGCDEGYGGDTCQYEICQTLNCSGHGLCFSEFGGDVCDCFEGWEGEMCEISLCFGKSGDEACGGPAQGMCIDNICVCDPWFQGEECQAPKCRTDDDCVYGVCLPDATCSCDPGVFGFSCEYPTCYGSWQPEEVCGGNDPYPHGICTLNGTCSCSPGLYDGVECTVPYCGDYLATQTDLVCSGGKGFCAENNTCVCEWGLAGAYCEYAACPGDGSCTGGRGTCYDGVCDCGGTYDGTECEISYCDGISSDETVPPLACAGHGSCVDTDVCICDSDWGGLFCHIPKCGGILASGGGDPNLSGDPKEECYGRGYCVTSHLCECYDTTQFGGPLCQYPVCFGLLSIERYVCRRKGVCEEPDTCKCNEGWGGSDCSENLDWDDGEEEPALSTAEVAGIAAGSVLGVLCIVCVVFCVFVVIFERLEARRGDKYSGELTVRRELDEYYV